MTMQPEQQYLAFLAEGRFMLMRERVSGRYMFYPRVAQPFTGSTDLEWVPASGGGVVYSTSIMRQRAPARDYNVALVDLDEGVRMMSRVEGIPPQDVRIGMRVNAEIVSEDGQPLVIFKPERI
jgi:uncharacterized protein